MVWDNWNHRKILKTRCNVKKHYQLFSCLLFLVGKQPHWEKNVLAQTGPKHRSHAINRYTVYQMNISKSRHKLHSHLRDRQNEKAWKWTIVGGFAFGVPASLCKAFDNFVYHSCTVPIGNQDIHRNPKCGFVKSGMHFFSQTHVEDFNAMCGVFVEDALPAIWKNYLGVVHLNDMSIRPGPW